MVWALLAFLVFTCACAVVGVAMALSAGINAAQDRRTERRRTERLRAVREAARATTPLEFNEFGQQKCPPPKGAGE